MTDKDDDMSNSSRTVSSGLSDSWSLVNTDGDIADDDSCSTTSSVEVVDDDGAEEDQRSQPMSLSTSPSLATPKGPMFVLCLTSHDVSDTDDDQPSSAVTDGIANSESFDILSEQKQGKKVDSDISQSQATESSPELEEHVESLLKAISEVKTSYESGGAGPGSLVDSDQNSLSKNEGNKDENESTNTGTLQEPQIEAVEDSGSSERSIQSVGMKTWADTIDEDELTTSDFSFINNDKDVSGSKDSLDTSDSTVMNQSMERTENAGDQELTENEATGESAGENETENQSNHQNSNLGERLMQWYNSISDPLTSRIQGMSRDSIISYMCVVMAVMFLASTYTAYTVLLKKDKVTKHVEQYQFLLDNYNHVQGELDKCRQTKEQIKFDMASADQIFEVPLQKITKLLRGWKYASPERRQSMVDELSNEAHNSCGIDNRNCNLGGADGQDSIANRISEIAYLLKLNFDEKIELEKTIQNSNLEISKLSASLEETKWKLVKAEMAIAQQSFDNIERDDQLQKQAKEAKWDRNEQSATSNKPYDGLEDKFEDKRSNLAEDRTEIPDAESKLKQQLSKEEISDEKKEFESKKDPFDEKEDKSEEEILFNQCLNVMVDYYKKKVNEKPKFEWFDYGSGVMREYLFGYLHDIIPENMQAFMRRLNTREATLNTQDNQDQGTDSTQDDAIKSETVFDKQWEEIPGSGERTDKDKDHDDDNESYDDHKDIYDDNERQDNENNDSDSSNSSAGRWTDSILDMMNKTRTQLQETWDQVKNVSEKIWIKHEPAITKLQNTFKRKLQNLSTKFQEKLTKKARKWFNKSKKGSRKDKHGDQKEENFAKTQRRKESRGSSMEKMNPDLCQHFLQMRDLLGRKMNAHKFRRSELSPNLINRMKNLKRDDELPKSSSIRNWLDCQLDWWANNENYPIEMPQYVVTDRCFDWLECWQIEISEGDHGIGRKKCERLKKANNVEESLTGCEVLGSKTEDEDLKNEHFDDHDSDGDDDLDEYDCDDTENDLSDEDIENWFLRRAEMRDYHHTQPDDWYFRRYNKWQQETTGKKTNFDL